MVKSELNEVVFIHKIISEYDIKGADAPFIASILKKLVSEAQVLQKETEKTKK